LPYPVFESVTLRLGELQAERAKNEVFMGVVAALNGKDTIKLLMDSSGNIIKQTKYKYTEEQLKKATQRAMEVAKQFSKGSE
jgi:hypothetical protein